jgi:hypothetical protein
VLWIHDGRKTNKRKSVNHYGTLERAMHRKHAVYRLTLAFLRVGSFLTGRAPEGGGIAFGDWAPIVNMALPLSPVPGVCGVGVPNGAAGVCGVPPPKLNVKPCCMAGDVGCPAAEPNPNGFGAGC